MSGKHDPKPSTVGDTNAILKPRYRANARWVCGYQATGMGCSDGPSETGKCCQLANEASGAKQVDCSASCPCVDQCELAALRKSPTLPSHEELGPCVPRRAAWFSREIFAVNAALLTGGILLLCMVLPGREQVFVPGGLSSKHSQILGNRLVQDRCSLCHESQHGDRAGLVQDELCMKCHQSHMPDAQLRSPHDLTSFQLISISNKSKLDSHEQVADDATHCASCHVEHHGSDHKISAISDARCQACHAKKFSSLSAGHPEFTNFPYAGRRNLAFDHGLHSGKYFAQKGEVFDCRECHVSPLDSAQLSSVERTVGFENSCARCHNDSLRSRSIGGWAAISVPSIEEGDTQSGDVALADWPSGALYGHDGTVPLMMRILLAGDSQTIAVLDKLPPSGELAKIPDAETRSEVALAIARSTRRLIDELAIDGQAAWQRRMEGLAISQLGRELHNDETRLIAQLTEGLPPNLFRQIQSQWFGKTNRLAGDLPRGSARLASQARLASGDDDALLLEDDSDLLFSDEGEQSDASDILGDGPASEDAPAKLTKLDGASHLSAGGWYLDDELYTLRYMPTGHADSTVAAWTAFAKLLGEHSRSGAGQAIAESASSDAIVASCSECHRLGSSQNRIVGSWKAIVRPASVRQFTKFNHQPHLTLPAVSDCRYCHVLRPIDVDVDSAAQESGIDSGGPKRFAKLTSSGSAGQGSTKFGGWHNDFVPMELRQCSACHRDGAAKDDCTTCHFYHVGTPGFEWSQSMDAGRNLLEKVLSSEN